jgi:nitrile hydratase accessory protein
LKPATGAPLSDDVALMEGPAALPRDNGELVFSAPWEARAFALAVALVERLDLPWDAFRSRLIEQIAAVPDRPYYESWATALESLVLSLGLTTTEALAAAMPTQRRPL